MVSSAYVEDDTAVEGDERGALVDLVEHVLEAVQLEVLRQQRVHQSDVVELRLQLHACRRDKTVGEQGHPTSTTDGHYTRRRTCTSMMVVMSEASKRLMAKSMFCLSLLFMR